MTATDDYAPEFRWRLSAPESLVLLWGPETGDAWALKVALLELVVRRVFLLSAVEKKRLFRSRTSVNVLTHNEPLDPSAARPLQAVVEAYMGGRTAGDSSSISVDKLATAVFTRRFRRVRRKIFGHLWDRSGGGYVEAEVLPELERQGLFTRAQSVRLVIFPSIRWSLTPQGNATLEDLKRFMAIGRDSFANWVERDPELARSYVERAGTSVLLVGGIAPHLRFLQSKDDQRGGRSGDPLAVAALAGAFGPGPLDDLDVAFFTLSEDIERAWDALLRGGGFFAGGE